ncbi:MULTISPECIES: AfsA-related hotdog domain-containing protein [unclassified Pseudomonas]|uniref:AfsA-related hotdog domain-containing protein n=1 Tax=unclassified Pseudomonas TaxID=196821 RepID=UPI002114A0A9|nr:MULTISPECIES: AfsA-related hotdog domain-containing protein [unclassified Pseudomonas]MDW3716409.1 AfsA-related hotdog domain-containing protein [Pseudomonas sp. 2023EL-01195]
MIKDADGSAVDSLTRSFDMGVYLIVADRFDVFSKQRNVLTCSALRQSLGGRGVVQLKGSRFVAGQGLSSEQIDQFHDMALELGYVEEFRHWRTWADQEPASVRLSHKRKKQNVLISTPERRGDVFVAGLLLDANNELMLDHLTGQHVQGMVLTEACRQMFLAVTERFHLADFQSVERYFVLNEMAMRFLAFAFPLPAEIRYRLLDMKQPRPDRVDVHADMEVWQGEQPVAGMTVRFSVMDAELIGVRECRLAASALAAQLRRLRRRLGIVPAENALGVNL